MLYWRMRIPTKIKIFLWRLCVDRLPTIDNLSRRSVVVPNFCALCGEHGESSMHLFWMCNFIRRILCCTVTLGRWSRR